MVEQLLGMAGGFLTLLALVLAAAGVRALRRPRRFCAGKGKGWRRWLIPWRGAWEPACGYDMTGLPCTADRVVCPECGTSAHPTQWSRRSSGFRPWPAAALASVAATACLLAAWERAGSWVGACPTVGLVLLDRECLGRHARSARVELGRRLAERRISRLEARILTEQLIAQLGSDQRWHNATRAADQLLEVWPASQPALESALNSADRQTRMLAAWLLRSKYASPTEALLRVSLEDLADDTDARHDWPNAWDAARYLSLHPGPARHYLRTAMERGDWQQKLLGAAIAARCRMGDLTNLAAPILIEHLGDNTVERDAHLAAPLLLHLGSPALRFLEERRDDPDPQRGQLCRAILARLGHPTDAGRSELDRAPPLSAGGPDPLGDVDGALDHVLLLRRPR